MHYRSSPLSTSQLPGICQRRRPWTRGLLTAALALLAGSLAYAGPATTPAPVVDQSLSVFVDDPNFGRDPFFPRSQRRKRTAAVEDTNVVVVVVAEDLILKGLSGTAEKRLAIINNYTFEAGEEYVLRMANGPVKVRCIEIRDRSVVISVNGLTKELRMREKL